MEETDEDIMECINNLHYLRFFLLYKFFQHNHSQLGIIHSSRYYSKIKTAGSFIFWKDNHPLLPFLPKNYIKNNDPDLYILEAFNCKYNKLWDEFVKIETHYLRNRYEYEFIKKDVYTILYLEYYNGAVINRLEFDQNTLEWEILCYCNDKVRSMEEILEYLNSKTKGQFCMEAIINILKELKNERIIYYSIDYSEIVTIVNTNLINGLG